MNCRQERAPVQTKKYVLCGNASAQGISEAPSNDIRLRLSGVQGAGNVTLRIEDIHSKTYSLLIDTFIKDPVKKKHLLRAFKTVPCVQ